MEKIINYENLNQFAYSNDKEIDGEIKGILIVFAGLNHLFTGPESEEIAQKAAKNNVVFISPYDNPWSWMNRQTISFIDEILDVLFKHYSLDETLPIVTAGASMGGLSALVYTRYASRTPVACITNCPVCDLPYHYNERFDLPRTLYSAFYNEDGKMKDVLKKFSPLHLAEKMPDIKYHIFACEKDSQVNKNAHSDKFVEKMKSLGRDITEYISYGSEHCALDRENWKQFTELMLHSFKKQQ